MDESENFVSPILVFTGRLASQQTNKPHDEKKLKSMCQNQQTLKLDFILFFLTQPSVLGPKRVPTHIGRQPAQKEKWFIQGSNSGQPLKNCRHLRVIK